MPLKRDCYVTVGFNACMMRDRGQKLSVKFLFAGCAVFSGKDGVQVY